MNRAKWWKAAGIRALKTFCQGLAALIGSNMINIVEIDWPEVLGIAATMALASILTSIVAGLPEVDSEEDNNYVDDGDC